MAKAKAEVNKSEAIRQAFDELPNAKTKEIVAHLERKGVAVTEGLVYKVKKGSKKKGKPGRKPGMVMQTKSPVSPPKVHLGVGASIALVKMTAEKIGGWSALKEIVDAMA